MGRLGITKWIPFEVAIVRLSHSCCCLLEAFAFYLKMKQHCPFVHVNSTLAEWIARWVCTPILEHSGEVEVPLRHPSLHKLTEFQSSIAIAVVPQEEQVYINLGDKLA
jgi:hypothetical protein